MTTIHSAARRAGAEKQNMRNARRNRQMCQMKGEGETGAAIAMQYGLAQSTVSVVLQQGLDYWQEWERKAIEAGVLPSAEPSVAGELGGAGSQMIDISLIDPNPWQPRDEVQDDDKFARLAESIYRGGLQASIGVRPEGERYTLAWGQRRLEVFRYWDALEWDNEDAEDDSPWPARYTETGITRIPAIVQEMTDAELIIAALDENMQREPLTWLQETRALQRASVELGISQRRLAAMVGLSPTNLNTRLAILRLPTRILELVGKELIPWTAARKLLQFAPASHTHEDELSYCEQRLWAKHREYVQQGRPEQRLTTEQVLVVMANSLDAHDALPWRLLERTPNGGGGFYIKGYNFTDGPRFDGEGFEKAMPEYAHTMPVMWGSTAQEYRMTCQHELWQDWQDQAIADEKARSWGHPDLADFVDLNPTSERLPEEFAQLVIDGVISREFCADLLGMVQDEHDLHTVQMRQLANRLKGVGIDLSDEQAEGVVLRWLQHHLSCRSLDDRLTASGFESPKMSIDEWRESYGERWMHTVPTRQGLATICCASKEWDSMQAAKVQATRDQVARGNQDSDKDVAQVIDGITFSTFCARCKTNDLKYRGQSLMGERKVRYHFRCSCGQEANAEYLKPKLRTEAMTSKSASLQPPCSGWTPDGDDKAYCVTHDSLAAAGEKRCAKRQELYDGMPTEGYDEADVQAFTTQGSTTEEQAAQLQDMAMASVPIGNTAESPQGESLVTTIGGLLDEDTLKALTDLEVVMSEFFASESDAPTAAELRDLQEHCELAGLLLKPYLG